VFISDNGFAAGEHRLSNKQCEYLACHRVPFVVACPTGVCAGTVPGAVDGDNYALNIDIAPTLADLAGATPTLAVDGRSLVPILKDPSAAWRTEWFLREQTPTMDGIVGEASDGHTYKYVAIDTGETEMYDLDSDPWELINLAGDPAYATIESDLVARLDAHING
jgi:arylsulfatase A-like enzyme